MSDESYREVYKQLRQAHEKHTYFLLAAAGAAIGFVINQTQGRGVSWSQVPLAAAVLCWALSFFFGCRYVAYVNSTLYSNAELLRVEGGIHPEVGKQPEMMAAASDGIRTAIEANSERANILGHRQFRLLVAGAVSYIVWHVLEMIVR